MRCFRVTSSTRVEPFMDLARDLTVGVHTVAEAQSRAVAACGLELVDVEDPSEITERPALVLYDDVWVSEMALRQFVAEALGASTELRLALPDGPVARAVDPFEELDVSEDGGRAVDVALLLDPAPLVERAGLALRARPWSLPSREVITSFALPPSSTADEGPGARNADVSITARVAGPVRHWLHVLRLSQLSVGVSVLDALRAAPRRMLRLRWMKGRDPWTIARKLVFVHPTARVHPTADLEAAVVGPGAVIEAHAHVHRSVVGANARIGDHSAVVGCALADRVQVLRASYFALCAAMPDATIASYKAQMSLFGREVFLTSSAWLIDAKLQGEVSVLRDGRPVPVGPFLGCCLGHQVTLGAQVLVQAGRAVPNGATIVGEPERFLSRTDGLPEGRVGTIRGGRLEPL